MGNYIPSSFKTQEPTLHASNATKKRTIEDVDEDEKDKLQEENLHTPKRKKLKTTSKYIYQTLFLNGENSDITIVTLGREWQLHKVYLCQSSYFASMFSGCWKESNQSVIEMSIPDHNIDEPALEVALGSLYRDDVSIKPARVVSVLAAATLLGLDGLIQQCADIMKETISSKTVCSYHTSSLMYGQQFVTKNCIEWLEKNIMTSQSVSLLREISIDLMQEVVSSADLFVIQVEMDIYAMLKKWMFLQLVPSWSGSSKNIGVEADAYYKKHNQENCFLDTDKGLSFASVFRCIRIQHVINDMGSAELMESDKIVPKSWLLPIYKAQWFQMLHVEYEKDKGPEEKVTTDFPRLAMRCGRVLIKDGEYCWRWTGYSYGIDILMSFTNRLVIIKRNTRSQNCPNSVSLQAKRNIMFRVTVASFDGLGQTRYIKSSGVMRLSLSPDEETVIMNVDRHAVFPLHVSVNMLVYSPSSSLKRSLLNKQNRTPQSSPSSSLDTSQGSPSSSSGTPMGTPGFSPERRHSLNLSPGTSINRLNLDINISNSEENNDTGVGQPV